jgi:hypothetical protein
MAYKSTGKQVGLTARMSHNKKKIAITASIILAAVPATAVALSITSNTGSTKPANVSIHASSDTTAPTTTAPLTTVQPEATTVHASDNSAGDKSGNTSMTVNGQAVDVPDNGSVDKTIPTNDGATSVEVNTSSPGSANSSSHSNVNINIQSSSNSSSKSTKSSSHVNVYSDQ